MKRLATAFLVVGVLLAGLAPAQRAVAASAEAAAQQELQKMQGAWRAVRLVIGDKPVDPESLSKRGFGVSLDVVGDRFHFVGIGAEFRGRLKIEGSGKSTHVVFLRDDGSATASLVQWDQGLLKLVGMGPSAPAAGDKNAATWVFKRDSPDGRTGGR